MWAFYLVITLRTYFLIVLIAGVGGLSEPDDPFLQDFLKLLKNILIIGIILLRR